MTHSEEKITSQLARYDSSTTSDWLRLSIMLLLLVVGRAVAPLRSNVAAPKKQPAHLTLSSLANAASEKLPVQSAGLYSTVPTP